MATAASSDSSDYYFKGLLRLVLLLLGSDVPEALGSVWRLVRHLFNARAHEGIYEVLEYEARLEVQDRRGDTAVYHKRERVRFVQDHIIAFQDQAWGDGDIFADYKCAPGEAVDIYLQGDRYRILISLRDTKHRGDVEEFRIERTIKDGFTKEVEDFQTEIDHPTEKLSLSVIFPAERFPKQVAVMERNRARTIALGPRHFRTLPDGRQQVTWKMKKPRLYESYILRWHW